MPTQEQQNLVDLVLENGYLPHVPTKPIISWANLGPRGSYSGADNIVLGNDVTGEELILTLVHEYGHVYEKQLLSDADRAAILAQTGRGSMNWRSLELIHHLRPEEQWAMAFARIYMTPFVGYEAADVLDEDWFIFKRDVRRIITPYRIVVQLANGARIRADFASEDEVGDAYSLVWETQSGGRVLAEGYATR